MCVAWINCRTPLHYAIQRKDFNLTQMLVNAGADVNALDENGRNSMHYAVNAADCTFSFPFQMTCVFLA